LTDWQSKLYGAYISTGQSTASGEEAVETLLSDHPHYEHIIRRHLPDDRSLRIADLACGHGALVFCLRALGYVHVEGIDVSPEQVALAHRRGLREVHAGDMMEFLRGKDGVYDVIFLMDILEHLDKQAVMDLLEGAARALTRRGRLIVHVPNAEGMFGMRIRYGDFTHQTCFTPRSIRQVLLASGFRDVAAYEERPLVHGVKSLIRRMLWSSLVFRDRLLLLAETGTWGHILSQNMLVVAGKGEREVKNGAAID
jgi:SAM-dependent methyltransferase